MFLKIAAEKGYRPAEIEAFSGSYNLFPEGEIP
jgi:hypothetical protein